MKLQLLSTCALLAACSDDPVNYSSPVGINLKAESGAVNNTVIADEKGITTESGNPYGAFVSAATNELGREPARVEIEDLDLLLGGTSTGVTALEQVYTGSVEVLFVMGDSNNSYPIATVTDPKGSTADMSIGFESKDISATDWDKFLGGGFKVVIRGTAATDFATKGAKADLQLTFTFAAFE